MNNLKTVSEFEEFINNQEKPHSDFFIADTLGFIVSTNNKPFMNKFMSLISQSDKEKVIALLKAEGDEYNDWVNEQSGVDVGGGSIDQDVFYSENEIESLVNDVLGRGEDYGGYDGIPATTTDDGGYYDGYDDDVPATSMDDTRDDTGVDTPSDYDDYGSEYNDYNFDVDAADDDGEFGDEFIKEIEKSLKDSTI